MVADGIEKNKQRRQGRIKLGGVDRTYEGNILCVETDAPWQVSGFSVSCSLKKLPDMDENKGKDKREHEGIEPGPEIFLGGAGKEEKGDDQCVKAPEETEFHVPNHESGKRILVKERKVFKNISQAAAHKESQEQIKEIMGKEGNTHFLAAHEFQKEKSPEKQGEGQKDVERPKREGAVLENDFKHNTFVIRVSCLVIRELTRYT